MPWLRSTRSVIFYVGTVAGAVVAGWIGERYGWRYSFVLFGGLGILLGLALLRYLREPSEVADAGPKLSFASFVAFARTLGHTPSAALQMLAFGAVNFVAVVQLAWMPSYLYQRFHLSLAIAAFLATMVAQGGAVLGAVAGGILADRRSHLPGGRILVQITGTLLGVPCVYLCGRGASLTAVLVALGAWGFCKGLYDANTFASLFDVLPVSMRGVATGFMNSSGWLLGGTTAPVLIGFLSMRLGLGNAIGIAGCGYIVAACLLGSALRMRSRRVYVSVR